MSATKLLRRALGVGEEYRYTDWKPRRPDPAPDGAPPGFQGWPVSSVVIRRDGVVLEDAWMFTRGRAEVSLECPPRKFRRDDPAVLVALAEKFAPELVEEVRLVLGQPPASAPTS